MLPTVEFKLEFSNLTARMYPFNWTFSLEKNKNNVRQLRNSECIVAQLPIQSRERVTIHLETDTDVTSPPLLLGPSPYCSLPLSLSLSF